MNEDIVLNKFSQRLSTLIKEHDTNINDLIKVLGIKSKSTIYRYINAEMSPKITTVKYLAEFYNVNPVWLMGYDVPKENQIQKIQSNIFPITDEPIKVPVLGKISAGMPMSATENIEGYEFAPSSYIKDGYNYFYLKVQGDSMNLKFNEGDIVLVQQQDLLENGEIGVILVNGDDATVKKYKKENGLVILEPMSTNTENTVQIYDPKKINIRIVGKVVSYQGKIN